MPFIPNLHYERPPQPRFAPAPGDLQPVIGWPLIDVLYDYRKVIDGGRTIGKLPEPARKKKVAIIGAGAAGLLAGYELLRMGLQADIFEGSPRIGGRAWSRRFHEQDGSDADVFAEMGSMRVPVATNLVFKHYMEQFGMTPTAFPDPGVVLTRLYYQNKVYDWKPKADPPGPFEPLNSDWTNLMNTLLPPFNDNWYDKETPADPYHRLIPLWQQLINQYKNTTFFGGLRTAFPWWSDADFNAFGALGIGSGGFGPVYQVDFLEIFRLCVNQFETNQQMMLEGMEAMPHGFYKTKVRMPDGRRASLESLNLVRTETTVESITHDRGKLHLVILPKNKERYHDDYDAVIVATTTRSMEYMNLTLPTTNGNQLLPQSVRTAIRNLHLMESSKLFIRTKTKYWKKKGVPQTILTDELPRALYGLDYPNTDHGVVCVSYTWGDDSARLLALSPENRFLRFREIISKVSPEVGKALVPVNDEIFSIDWEAERQYFGAFKLQYPGQEPDLHAAYYHFLTVKYPELDRGIYLAGDSVSWAGGWTEGALQTGINAVAAVTMHLGGKIVGPSPLDQNPAQYQYA